jgi:6-pyruvoyltetrahydropterin/6-carboxytetrahydropterin synthase
MNEVTISKRFDFDAAHWLPHVCEGHKCGRLHGHTYVVELRLRGVPDERMGWFVDYAEIAAAWAPLNDQLDHRLLNEIEGLDNPTTEVLVPWIANKLKQTPIGQWLCAVRVYESSTTWCEMEIK